jgi:dipeptidyl aminopeptidase/acylaminoacyl peptidase
MPTRAAVAAALAALFAPAVAGAAWPGGDGRIVWSSGGDLSTDAGRLTDTPVEEAQAAWSPDGTRLAFRVGTAGTRDVLHVAVMASDGSGRTDLPGSANHESQPGWSADGARIVYRSSVPGDAHSGDIWVMNADGSGKHPLGDAAAAGSDERYPVFSPDGTRIAFTSDRDGDFEIYVAAADGSGPVKLTDNAVFDSAPSWSPDGTRIAFERGPAGDSPGNEVWTLGLDPARRDERRLTTNDVLDEGPAWAPAGDAIVFTSLRAGSSDIWRMQPDGSDPVAVTTAAAKEESPDWQPLPVAAPRPIAPPRDRDHDGLSVARERRLRTSDLDRDSDDDGIGDGVEVRHRRGDPHRFDTDRDGLSDGQERNVRRPVADPPGPVRGTALERFRRPPRRHRHLTSPYRPDRPPATARRSSSA